MNFLPHNLGTPGTELRIRGPKDDGAQAFVSQVVVNLSLSPLAISVCSVLTAIHGEDELKGGGTTVFQKDLSQIANKTW
jgi:hypothetical protein